MDRRQCWNDVPRGPAVAIMFVIRVGLDDRYGVCIEQSIKGYNAAAISYNILITGNMW